MLKWWRGECMFAEKKKNEEHNYSYSPNTVVKSLLVLLSSLIRSIANPLNVLPPLCCYTFFCVSFSLSRFLRFQFLIKDFSTESFSFFSAFFTATHPYVWALRMGAHKCAFAYFHICVRMYRTLYKILIRISWIKFSFKQQLLCRRCRLFMSRFAVKNVNQWTSVVVYVYTLTSVYVWQIHTIQNVTS